MSTSRSSSVASASQRPAVRTRPRVRSIQASAHGTMARSTLPSSVTCRWYDSIPAAASSREPSTKRARLLLTSSQPGPMGNSATTRCSPSPMRCRSARKPPSACTETISSSATWRRRSSSSGWPRSTVSRIAAISRGGLRRERTASTVRVSCARPSSARYSDWTGTTTASAATRALMVRSPSDGGQSTRTRS